MARGLVRGGFNGDLQLGRLYEGKLAQLLGRTDEGIEVKADHEAIHTGNVFVEARQKGVQSGIATTNSKWWFFALIDPDDDEPVWVGITEKRLKDLCRRAGASELVARGGDFNQYDGFKVKVRWLVERWLGKGSS